MKVHIPSVVFLIFLIKLLPAFADERIVMLRHAEKPILGLGQLSCQGLNRSLALPNVLIIKFGKPSAIFAPNPGIHKADIGGSFNYIRPLATIEPTAIQLEMPVNTDFGYEDIHSLENALLNSTYKNSTVYVVWEHHLLEALAQQLMSDLSKNPPQIPKWDNSDFDGIYVITISSEDGLKKISFLKENEGLDHMQATCPILK